MPNNNKKPNEQAPAGFGTDDTNSSSGQQPVGAAGMSSGNMNTMPRASRPTVFDTFESRVNQHFSVLKAEVEAAKQDIDPEKKREMKARLEAFLASVDSRQMTPGSGERMKAEIKGLIEKVDALGTASAGPASAGPK